MVRSIFREFGADGLNMDEAIQHGLSKGLQETDVSRAVKQLHDAGEIFKSPNGTYKLA